MARIAFLDRLPWDYRVDTPGKRPLGGSQSALCYLARALAALGHAVRLVTMTRDPAVVDGVDCRSAADGGTALFQGMDAVVVLNDPDPVLGEAIRAQLETQARLVLWTQHDVDQPAVAPYADEETRRRFDHVVFVSDWQRRAYARAFGASPHETVIGNAVAPAFAALFAADEPVLAAKMSPPVLAYTPTPFRGLDVLLDALPLIRAREPEARLRVHSGLSVYQVAEADDPYRDLYARCRATPGVDYVGPVAQPLLARSLKETLVFAYPSTFPETFCTSAVEAMAAGCLAVVGDLGALAETTQGLAVRVAADGERAAYVGRFADAVVQALAERHSPDALEARLRRQRRQILETASWQVRARAWSALLAA